MGRKPGSKNRTKTPTEQPAATTGEVLGEPGNVTPMTEGQSLEQEDKVERKARAKQLQIPGTEGPKIEAIELAAEDYVRYRVAMQEAVKAFKEKKTDLLNLMHANANDLPKHGDGGYCYKYDDIIVVVTPKDEVLKVKHIDPDEEEEVEEIHVGAPADNSEGE